MLSAGVLYATVVDGIPVDALIDSGALDVSLVSSDVLKYLSCLPEHRRCLLEGTSYKQILATSNITITIDFSDISVEIFVSGNSIRNFWS